MEEGLDEVEEDKDEVEEDKDNFGDTFPLILDSTTEMCSATE